MADRPGRFYPRLEQIAFGLTVVLVPAVLAVAGWTTQEHPNRIDRYLFEQMGQTVLDGGTVYLDCWDNKPPGLCWWNALVLFLGGRSVYAVTVAAVVTAVLAVGVTGWSVARIHGRSVASLTMLVFTLVLSQRYYDALTNGTELYAMAAEGFAAAFWIAAMTERGRRGLMFALLAGAAWGVAGMVKQTGAAGPIAMTLVMILAMFAGPVQRALWLHRFLMMSAGILVVLGGVAGMLHHQGALGEAYYASVTFNLHPEAPGAARWTFDLSRLAGQLEPLLGVCLLAAVGAVVTFLSSESADRTESESQGSGTKRGAEEADLRTLPRSLILVLLLWIAIAVYGVGLGPNHMPRYP